MTDGSYEYKHGFKDDYVVPHIDLVKSLDHQLGEDFPALRNIFRMIVHEGLINESTFRG